MSERGPTVNKPRNDLNSPVPKFCLVLETSRRTTEGRVRTAHELVAHFFPHSEASSTDRLFHYLPPDVRGPILTSWGVRGQRSALRDSDEKVRNVVHDALVAGDVDAPMFESSIAPEVFVRWVDLPDWWTFWRGGRLAKYSILKALESGYELGLFDADWFLQTVASKDGKLRGTNLLSEGLSKADLTEWLRAIYVTADGSPRGIVAALGWDQIVSKTPDDVLLAVLDAIAIKVGLKEDAKPKKGEAVAAATTTHAPVVHAAAPVAAPAAAPAARQVDEEEEEEEEEPPAEAAPKMETWTPSAPATAAIEEPEARPSATNLKLPGVPIASVSRAPAHEAPAKEAPRTSSQPDIKPAARKLPAIFIPSSARLSDLPVEARHAPPPAEPAAAFKDEEIPISADAFDDLSEGVKPASVRPEATTKPKRPSKAPKG